MINGSGLKIIKVVFEAAPSQLSHQEGRHPRCTRDCYYFQSELSSNCAGVDIVFKDQNRQNVN